jgi:hypothetical protein
LSRQFRRPLLESFDPRLEFVFLDQALGIPVDEPRDASADFLTLRAELGQGDCLRIKTRALQTPAILLFKTPRIGE